MSALSAAQTASPLGRGIKNNGSVFPFPPLAILQNLAEAVTDVKTYEKQGKLSWIWNKTKKILTSDAAKKTIEKIADKAIQTVIKSLIGA